MRRGRPLRRRVPPQRRTSLRSTSPPLVASSHPDQLTRAIVLERDGYCCAGCGRGAGLHLHHRLPLGRGGSRDPQAHVAVNLVSVCPPCHDGIHADPVLARQLGLLVRRGVNPAAVPVSTLRRGLVLLTSDGWLADVADVEPDGYGTVAGVA